MPPSCSRIFLDRFRLRRSLAVGTVLTVALNAFLTLQEALSIGMLIALSLDATLFFRATWSLNFEETKALFDHERLHSGLLIKRSVAANFLGLGVMSLCISDLGSKHSVLLEDVRIFIYFVSILLIWISLHHGFALHYAKVFFHYNSKSDSRYGVKKVFSFPGDTRPVLFDFVYVAYCIGLTFGMTDVGAELTEVRKIIVIQAMLAFLYATTAISAVASLFTA